MMNYVRQWTWVGALRGVSSLALVAVGTFGISACLSGGGSDGAGGADDGTGRLGSVAFAINLAAGISADRADYTIAGPGNFSRQSSLEVRHSATLSTVIANIPAATGYTITISAMASDSATRCTGSGIFDVVAHATTAIAIHLTCHEASRTGSVSVSGTINICPLIDGVSANPAEVTVGNSIALSVAVHDADNGPSPLTISWSASSGVFTEAAAGNVTFTCVKPGAVIVMVDVSDGDTTAGCNDSAALRIVCSIPGSASAPTVSTLAVYGDSPYGVNPADTTQLQAAPAFIASINADPAVGMVLQVGDIHSGKQYCTEAYDRAIYDLWSSFADPLVYTPGDNEWSDCHKAAQGGGTYNPVSQQIDFVVDSNGNPVDYANGDPVANLALVRSIFYPRPGMTLGMQKSEVLSQAQLQDPSHPTDASYVENVMWEQSRVLFVSINLPGGSNNDNDVWYGAPAPTAVQTQEIEQRTGADLRWLEIAFAQAQADGVAAVVIAAQADMWDPEKGVAHQAAYEPFVQSIAAHTASFGKPVLMFNGDSHVYLSHNPLSAGDALAYMHPGYDVPNFHRIVVHGSTLPLEWLRLTVDPHATAPRGDKAFGPFTWERIIQ